MTIVCICVKWKKHFWAIFGLTHPIKFLLTRTYCLEEDVALSLSGLLFSSWLTKYLNKMSLFILSLHVAWFLLKRTFGFQEEVVSRIPRWLFYAWPSLISEWIDLSNSVSPFYLSLRSNRYLVWKKMILFEEIQTTFMVAQHTDSASCESTTPSIMPYKPSQYALQICRWFLYCFTVQNNNLTTISLSNVYMAEPFYNYWFYTTQQHTKTLFCGEIIFQYL